MFSVTVNFYITEHGQAGEVGHHLIDTVRIECIGNIPENYKGTKTTSRLFKYVKTSMQNFMLYCSFA